MCALKFQQSSSDDSSDGTAFNKADQGYKSDLLRYFTHVASSNMATGETHTCYGAIQVGEVAEAEALALAAGRYTTDESPAARSRDQMVIRIGDYATDGAMWLLI